MDKITFENVYVAIAGGYNKPRKFFDVYVEDERGKRFQRTLWVWPDEDEAAMQRQYEDCVTSTVTCGWGQ